MNLQEIALDIANFRRHYSAGDFTPEMLIDALLAKSANYSANPIWITRLNKTDLQPYLDNLKNRSVAELPLYGVPFALKDNIDLAAVPTTAACKEFAYTPENSAFVAQRLIDLGAIPMGKCNLDQFATGLVGTRSPYGAVKNSFNPDYISGGSSSGNAVAVALGLVSFSLGTDTAGSGRVPAAFNNLIGVKPTRGVLSNTGVLPACRSLDCVAIFALNIDDGEHLHNLLAVYDSNDTYSRKEICAVPQRLPETFKVGVPRADQLQFFGNEDYQQLFQQFVTRLSGTSISGVGAEIIEIDFSPFIDCAKLLYEGPWVAERYAALEGFIATDLDALHAVTKAIIAPATEISAVNAFKAEYQRIGLKSRAEQIMQLVEFIVTPTAGSIFTIEQVNKDPIRLNSQLGYYTNFMNLLDLSSVAIPAGFTATGLPFGVTLVGKAFDDLKLCRRARQILKLSTQLQGATGFPWNPADISTSQGYFTVAVCGAHLSGMPLNWQLIQRQAVLLEKTQTAPKYRLYALAGGPPFRPGLIRNESDGAAIEVEVWQMPIEHFGSFMQGIPAPLGIGSVELMDGGWVNSFICEGYVIGTARDITALGSWRLFKP